MIRKSAVLSIAMLVVAGAALAAPGKKPVKKITHVMTCPIMGGKATTTGATSKVDNYVVHYCCPGCKPAFDKLSKKDKIAKIQSAMKGGAKKSSKVEASLIQVKTCPVTDEKIEGDSGGSLVFGKYEVHFCCAGCKPAFEKMSEAEKEAKIQGILKKS